VVRRTFGPDPAGPVTDTRGPTGAAPAIEELRVTALTEMTSEECRTLLATHRPRLGRLAFLADGRAQVFPMNYVAVGDRIYFRTAPGSKLRAAARSQEVTFELDDVDEVWREGWSVLVYGRLHEVTDEAELADVRQRPLRPWAGDDRPHVLRLDIRRLTGRRII
jgi:nitroimidazol reductase NimA-like FMN-containing flavoprotein (pyridoxamine 5'-phosphate oxidase superfamily)